MMKERHRDNTHTLKTQKENSYITRLIFETDREFTGPEPLADMEYKDELLCKDRAFSSFWYETGGHCSSSRIIESPLPRKYRTTTKRRVHKRGGGVILASDEFSRSDSRSSLEPDFHADIYDELAGVLNSDINRRISGILNFVIIRGNYESCALIFNVKMMSGDTVNALTRIAERLRENNEKINAAFIYHDPEGSKYYFNTSSDVDGPRMKRLFGNRNLSIKVNETIYTFAPEGFSQVNLSICGEMLGTAQRLLQHKGKGRLLDLYCGYGFFSCFLAGDFVEIIGVDYGETAIDSARENMKRVKSGAKWEYHARRIEKKSIPSLLPAGRLPEYIILDPPRNGTAQGVIETLAMRGPELALHIFCGIETIPYELEKWERSGYEAVECVPLDMFPGTPDLEVMVLFRKNRFERRRR